MTMNLDSGDIPSIGSKLTGNDKSIAITESKRQWAVWIYKLICKTINENPKIAELERICERQQIELNRKDQLVNELLGKLDQALEDIEVLKAETKSYRNWEDQISTHVSSIDQKSADINKLRSLIYALWDVTVQTLEPKATNAEMLIKGYRHLLRHGPSKRSYVKGDDITPLLGEKRWYNQDL